MPEIKMKCPCCGAVLKLKRVPVNKNSVIPCPVCASKVPFSEYKALAPSVSGRRNATLSSPQPAVEQAVEKIKKKCPHCNVVLKIKRVEGIEHKNIICAKCRTQLPFGLLLDVIDNPADAHKSENSADVPMRNIAIGKIVADEGGNVVCYQLKLGDNVIGRESETSRADIRLKGGSRMSRQHLLIKVEKSGNRAVHMASLVKEVCNPVKINKQKIIFGEEVILNNNDVIEFPGAIVKFVIE